jgi:O-acetyl-ADP-ribose deacetylase (regulator of RNase III)
MRVDVVLDEPFSDPADALFRTVGEGMEGLTAFCRRAGILAGEDTLARLRDSGEGAPVGAALLTPGGGLGAAFLIHGVIRSREEPVTPAGVVRALRNALELSVRWELRHLILPPLGTGAGNLAVEFAAQLCRTELRAHARTQPIPERVTIWVPGAYEAEVYRREFQGGEGEA